MRTYKVLALILCALFITSMAMAADNVRIAKILEMEGTVEVKGASGQWAPATMDMELKQGDMLRTKDDSFALLNVDGMAQTATVEVKQNSEMALAELTQNVQEKTQATLLDLAMGEVLIKAKKLHSEGSRFEVKTPTSIVGVRGTTFSVAVEAEPDE